MNTETQAAVLRPLPLISQSETAPGENAILHHWALTPTVIRDLVLEEGTAIVTLNVGPREIVRADGQSWGEAIRGSIVAQKTSITIVARNEGDAPKTLRATLHLEEQAQIVDAPAVRPQVSAAPPVQRQFGSAPRAVVTAGSVRQDGSPFVRATGARPQEPRIAAAPPASPQAAAPKKNVVRTQLKPLSERDPSVASTPNTARTQMRTQMNGAGGGRMRANGRAGARINAPRITPAANGETAMVRSATVRTTFQRGAPPRVQTSGGSITQSRVSHVPLTPRQTVEVTPNPGERCVVILHGHVERLILRVEKHVTLPKTFKPALIRALNQALGYDGPRVAGGNDVVVSVSPEDIHALMQVVNYGGFMIAEPQRTRVANALRLGLAVARATSAPETPAEAIGEVSAPALAVVPSEEENQNAAESG